MSTILIPPVLPDRNQDSLELYRAFRAYPLPDAKKVIEILGHRTIWQRCELRIVYKNMHEEDLLYHLDSHFHFNFKKAVMLWMRDHAEQGAAILKHALRRRTVKDFRPLIEVICFRDATELQAIAKAYSFLVGRSLENDIESTTTGHIQNFFLAYFRTCRDKRNTKVDTAAAEQDAKDLYDAGEGGKNFDENTFIRILGTRSTAHLCSAFDAYKHLYGHDIEKALKREPHGEFQELIRTLTLCIQHPARYFAKALYKSMKGLGTDDDTLIRIVVTRAEVDMKEIKQFFFQKYNLPLEQMIASDTSGSYRQFLLTLIGACHDTCAVAEHPEHWSP